MDRVVFVQCNAVDNFSDKLILVFLPLSQPSEVQLKIEKLLCLVKTRLFRDTNNYRAKTSDPVGCVNEFKNNRVCKDEREESGHKMENALGLMFRQSRLLAGNGAQ